MYLVFREEGFLLMARFCSSGWRLVVVVVVVVVVVEGVVNLELGRLERRRR
jgi:hypothetical protein